MRWFAVAVVLFAPVAWGEPPVSNPPPTPKSNEFPQPPKGPPLATKGVPKVVFFSVAGATVVVAVFAGVMTGLAQSDAQSSRSVFQLSANQLSERAALESQLATAGWIGAGLLAVASLLVGLVTRWGD